MAPRLLRKRLHPNKICSVAFMVLNDPHDIALRITQPRNGDLGGSHVRDRHDHGGAKLFGLVHVGVRIIDLDVDHDCRTADRISTADRATDAVTGSQQRVMRPSGQRPILQLPSE